MRLSHRFSFILICAILLQSIAPLVPSVEAKASPASRALLQASAIAHHVDEPWINPSLPAPENASIPNNEPFLPVIYKTGIIKSVATSTAQIDASLRVSATQPITNPKDILYLVNSGQIARTRNFFDFYPYWTSLISPTSPISGTKIYDFILDPYMPYYRAWIAGDTGIWRTTNLNDDWPDWQNVQSMHDITSTLPGPYNLQDLKVSRITGDVSKPGYYFVVLGANVWDGYAWVGYTFDYGHKWSWASLPQESPISFGTRLSNGSTGLALSQDGSGRIWLGAWAGSVCQARLVYSADYGQSWQVIWSHNFSGSPICYPTSLHFTRGTLFATMGVSVGKSLDNGKTWQFLSGAPDARTVLNYGINGSLATSKLVYYTAQSQDPALNGALRYSIDGGINFNTQSASLVGADASAVYAWQDDPNRMAWSRTNGLPYAENVLYFSENRGQSWQDKTGNWRDAFDKKWFGGDVFIASPYQSSYLRDESRRDPARRGKKEQDCALNCTPPVHFANDPVDTGNGNLSYQVADLSVASLGGNLTFQRSYASMDSNASRPLGYGWANNFDAQIITPITTAHPITVALQTANGSQLQFSISAAALTHPI